MHFFFSFLFSHLFELYVSSQNFFYLFLPSLPLSSFSSSTFLFSSSSFPCVILLFVSFFSPLFFSRTSTHVAQHPYVTRIIRVREADRETRFHAVRKMLLALGYYALVSPRWRIRIPLPLFSRIYPPRVMTFLRSTCVCMYVVTT